MSSAGSESFVALMSSMRRARSFSNSLSIEARAHQRVREQLEHQLLVAREELAADRDRLGARGHGEIAARPFDCIGEGERIALARAFLQQPATSDRRRRGFAVGRTAGRRATRPGTTTSGTSRLGTMSSVMPFGSTTRSCGGTCTAAAPGCVDSAYAVLMRLRVLRLRARASASASGISTPTVRRFTSSTSRATARTSSAVTRSNCCRRVEQLRPVAVEDFVLAEQLRLAIDRRELLPERRRRARFFARRSSAAVTPSCAMRASSASITVCTASGSAPSGSVKYSHSSAGSKPSCQ